VGTAKYLPCPYLAGTAKFIPGPYRLDMDPHTHTRTSVWGGDRKGVKENRWKVEGRRGKERKQRGKGGQEKEFRRKGK